MAEGRSSKTQLVLLLLVLSTLLGGGETSPHPLASCKSLCSINRTTEDHLNTCLQSCMATLEKIGEETPVSMDALMVEVQPIKSSNAERSFARVARSSDANQFVGPYQRRPHYLRIGRSGVSPVEEEVKRARPSHYLRIGRGYTDDISASGDELSEDKRGRPSHYLRIGRSQEEEEESMASGDVFDKRARPSYYLRIGRGGVSLDEPFLNEEQEKRARPAHYLRIGRSATEDSQLSEASDKRQEEFSAMSPYLAVYPLIKRDNKRPYRQSHYLRIGRS